MKPLEQIEAFKMIGEAWRGHYDASKDEDWITRGQVSDIIDDVLLGRMTLEEIRDALTPRCNAEWPVLPGNFYCGRAKGHENDEHTAYGPEGQTASWKVTLT